MGADKVVADGESRGLGVRSWGWSWGGHSSRLQRETYFLVDLLL